MFKHLVMWKLHAEVNGVLKEENGKKMKQQLEALQCLIPEIVALEVGLGCSRAESESDVVLISTFRSKEDFEIYREHPKHQEVTQFIKQAVCERRVVDYETLS